MRGEPIAVHGCRSVLVAALLLGWPLSLAAQERHSTEPAAADPACQALFEQAAAELAAEQYPKMLRVAQDRMRLCPDPESAFLLGLAEANMVDSFAVADPAQCEQMRLSALRNLRTAAAGGTLKPSFDFTTHAWIVHLQEIAPAGAQLPLEQEDGELDPLELGDEEEPYAQEPEPLEVPAAPPPQPQPVFPWGPVLTGIVGTAALTTGIVLSVAAGDNHDEAGRAARQLRIAAALLDDAALRDGVRRTRTLQEKADGQAKWGGIFLIGGAAALVVSVVWYVALPPKGKWRWAAVPPRAQATVRF
jgi:hypothetical protein